MLEIELNSYPIHPDISLDSSQIAVAIQLLIAVLTVAWKASDERLVGLVGVSGTPAVNAYSDTTAREFSDDSLMHYAYQLQYVINQ